MNTPAAKPFRVSCNWIEWAHGPGAADGQSKALALTQRAISSGRDYITIEADRADLVRELVSVAELYYPADGSIEWYQAAYAGSLIKRGRRWLAGGAA